MKNEGDKAKVFRNLEPRTHRDILPTESAEPVSEQEIAQIISDIKNVYRKVTGKLLKKDDPLRSKILNHFIDRDDADREYTFLLSRLSDSEKRQYAKRLEADLQDSDLFVSRMERYFSTQTIYQKQRSLQEKPRPASKEEYEMGVYLDLLEPQVKEAVQALNKKGYKSFQSGYDEKDPRRQFIDFYNSNVMIPVNIRTSLESKGIIVSVENFDDRTTVTLRPITNDRILRQQEWKKIWNQFAKGLPPADPGTVKNMTVPTMHKDFRDMQDTLKQLR